MRLTVAVSGASGFVGRHVVAALERRGVGVVLLQRSATAPTTATGIAAATATEPTTTSVNRVIAFDMNVATVDSFDRIGRPDALIHLAWGGLPNYRSAHHVDAELPAQRVMLDALIAGGLPRLVVAGTCFEYGMRVGELTEDTDPEPANAYAIAKDALRRHLESRQRERPFALTWARLFYLYGEGQAASSLWSQLTKAVANGDAEFPMSGGEQVRDFMAVEQAADALVALAVDARDAHDAHDGRDARGPLDGRDAHQTHGGLDRQDPCDAHGAHAPDAHHARGHGIVNICSGAPVTVRALVERWIAGQGWRIAPALGRYPYPDHEPMAFWGSRAKLDGILANARHHPGP